jgi:hypothetical protein
LTAFWFIPKITLLFLLFILPRFGWTSECFMKCQNCVYPKNLFDRKPCPRTSSLNVVGLANESHASLVHSVPEFALSSCITRPMILQSTKRFELDRSRNKELCMVVWIRQRKARSSAFPNHIGPRCKGLR